MNELMNVADGATMTSLEIAELCEKQHKNVLADIRTMLDGLEMGLEVSPSTYTDSSNREKPMYQLNKELTLTLTSGYSVKQRNKIIKRWLALEDSARIPTATQPLLPAEIGKVTVMAMLDVAKNCGVPDSYAMQVAAAEATRQTGMPWDKLLTKAAVMSDIPDEDVMLEPTELGALFGINSAMMNMRLATMGLQEKIGGKWTAIGDGCAISSRHAWTMHGKSGYNLKWKAGEIEAMIDSAHTG